MLDSYNEDTLEMNIDGEAIEEEDSIQKKSRRITNRRRLHQLYHSTDFSQKGQRN